MQSIPMPLPDFATSVAGSAQRGQAGRSRNQDRSRAGSSQQRGDQLHEERNSKEAWRIGEAIFKRRNPDANHAHAS